MGIGTGRKVFVKDSRRVESPWPPCPHNVTALYKNVSSHVPAPPSWSLGETTRAAAPVRALEGEAVTSPPQVQVAGRTDQARGLPPHAHALLSSSEPCVCASGAAFPGIRPSASWRHSSSPFLSRDCPDAGHPEVTPFSTQYPDSAPLAQF